MISPHQPKLTIYIETSPDKFDKAISALFNPNQLSINKRSKWMVRPTGEGDTGNVQFPCGEPASLNLDLFFDTYEDQTDVRQYTKEVFFLTTVQEHGNLHRPPLCKIQWGSFNISDEYQCTWVLKSLNQRFTLFLADGTPVRATLTCSFLQWRSDEVEERLLNRQSVDVAKRRIVQQGDTLSSIAFDEYEDAALWRPIAKANRIMQPRNIKPGQVLAIPALRSRKSI